MAKKPQKILIVGRNGQLGKELVKTYPDASALGRGELDISDRTAVESFDWSSYDVVINAAAYVNADESETQEGRKLTWRANAYGPRNLAWAALKHDFRLVHVSSEYVFDGTNKNHEEEETFTPVSVYGQTKAAGDLAVSLVAKHYILRTTWVVGDGHNFVRTMARLAKLRINPRVVDDQFGRLTFAQEITRAIDHLIKTDAAYGTYNVSNSGKVKSWAEIAADTFEIAGHDRQRVTPITTDEYKESKQYFAPRPTYSDLDLTKLTSTGFVSRDYEPMMKEYIEQLKDEE